MTRNIFVLSTILCFISVNIVQAETSLQVDQVKNQSVINNDLQDSIDRQALKNELARLKQQKNEKIEIIRQKEQTIVILALVITVLSVLVVIFFFAWRSVRRRRRIDIAELQAGLGK